MGEGEFEADDSDIVEGFAIAPELLVALEPGGIVEPTGGLRHFGVRAAVLPNGVLARNHRFHALAVRSLPSRATEAAPVRKRAALSDPQGHPTSFAREGQHPKVSATRKEVRCAANAAITAA